MMKMMNGEMTNFEVHIRTIQARTFTRPIQTDNEKDQGMRGEGVRMKNHELENEPELELPFEVPDEFVDYEEEDETMFSKKALLKQLAGIGEGE